jgi:hypothetical protein
MNLSSRTAAGRSRRAEGDLFSLRNVVHTTEGERSGPQAASPHAWKRGLQEKIWSNDGPKGIAARSVLSLLLWHADANGRVWLGIQAIASKTGAGSLKTVRNALDSLVRQGWLRSKSHTWASLSAEQAAAGRPVPRRGDVGQAPNLYVLLDGCGKTAGTEEPAKGTDVPRPGLARASFELQATPTPGQNDQGGPLQNCGGVPLADLHHDLDPKGSRSRIERAERAQRVDRSTHRVSKLGDEGFGWLETWNVIVETHADKTKSIYGLPPLPPDVKREQQKALAECLVSAAVDVCAKLRDRTGVERDVRDVQRELATRVMQLYFKRDNEHLRRVKHALRDLPREFHARITEAMQAMLRESHDEERPRQPQPEARFVETTVPVERPAAQTEAGQANTAREARRLLEMLGGVSSREASEQEMVLGQDKPIQRSQVVARPGAPRWGEVGPRPLMEKTAPALAKEVDDEFANSKWLQVDESCK